MSYAKIASVGGEVLQYPYTFNDLKKDNPKVSYPRNPTDAMLIAWGVYPVTNVPKPPFDRMTENVNQGEPTWDADSLKQTWIVEPASPEEIEERQKHQDAKDIEDEVRTDAFVKSFIQMTPLEIRNYVDANMTDLPSTRALIKKLAIMLLILTKNEFER